MKIFTENILQKYNLFGRIHDILKNAADEIDII